MVGREGVGAFRNKSNPPRKFLQKIPGIEHSYSSVRLQGSTRSADDLQLSNWSPNRATRAFNAATCNLHKRIVGLLFTSGIGGISCSFAS